MSPDAVMLSSALWVEHLLTGTTALSLATIAVAIVGVALFSGRIQARRSAEVVLGIAVVFGASMISRHLVGAGNRPGIATSGIASGPLIVDHAPPAAVYDPYAGASVPQQPPQQEIVAPV